MYTITTPKFPITFSFITSILLFLTFTTSQLTAQSCIDLLGVSRPTTNNILFQNIDPVTGDRSLVRDWTSDSPPVTMLPAVTAIDPNRSRIFYLPNDDNNKYFVNSEKQSPTILSVTAIELEYHCVADNLYALQVNGSNLSFIKINADDGNAAISGASILKDIGTDFELIAGTSTIDVAGDRYFIITKDLSNDEFILNIIDTNLGNLIKQVGFRNFDPISLHYDIDEGFLIGFGEDLSIWQIDPDAESFTEVGNMGIPVGVAPSNVILDPFTNTLYVLAKDAVNSLLLYEVSSENGNIQGSPLVIDEDIIDLVAATPCESKPQFDIFNACEGDITKFRDSSIGAKQWTWDFGDGSPISIEQNPTHQYAGPGVYDVKLSIDGCLGPKEVTVQLRIIEAPIVDLGDDIDVCETSTLLDAGSDFPEGTTFLWEHSPGTNAPKITVTVDACYTLIVDVQGCVREDEVCVTLGKSDTGTGLVNFVGITESTFCQGETITLEPSSGSQVEAYLWSTGDTTPTIDITTDGTYSVTLTLDGCTLEGEILAAFLPPTVFTLGDDVVECEERWTLNAGDTFAPNTTFEWSTGETEDSITVEQSNTYAVTVTEPDKCPAIDSVEVTLFGSIALDLGGDEEGNLNLCESDPTPILDAAPPNVDPSLLTFSWSNGQTTPTIEADESGIYSVEVRVGTCDTIVDEVFVQYFPEVVVNLPIDTAVCQGESLTLEDPDLKDVIYSWQTPSGTLASPTVSAQFAGTYTLTVANQGGCASSASVKVEVANVRNVDLGTDFTICAATNELVTLDAGEGIAYKWFPTGETSRSIMPQIGGDYSVEVTNSNGCFSLGTTTIIEKCASVIQFPAAFSPNSDSTNDIFKPIVQFVNGYALAIYDRWGNKVFESSDPTIGWDGLHEFEEQPLGTYFWVVSFLDNDNEETTQYGSVVLIK